MLVTIETVTKRTLDLNHPNRRTRKAERKVYLDARKKVVQFKRVDGICRENDACGLRHLVQTAFWYATLSGDYLEKISQYKTWSREWIEQSRRNRKKNIIPLP